MNYDTLFTVAVPFRDVPLDTEFLRHGLVYRKLNRDEADKVNAPSAGNIIDVDAREVVRISRLDATPSQRGGK